MNSYVFILSFLILVSLHDTSIRNDHIYYNNGKKVQIQLVDSLGTITLVIPERYDTSFSWIHRSDCGKSCDLQKYRFQPKYYPIVKESGWYWTEEATDSVDRLTISHSRYIPFSDGDTARNIGLHAHFKTQLSYTDPGMKIILDTILRINDRYFSIYEMERSDSIFVRELVAITTIKNNPVRFNYKMMSRKNDTLTKGFIKNALFLIKETKISKGQ